MNITLNGFWFYDSDKIANFSDNNTYHKHSIYLQFGPWEDWDKNDYFITNISNNRKSPTVIVGRGNHILGKKPTFYTYNKGDKTTLFNDGSYFEIGETTNLTKGNLLTDIFTDYGSHSSNGQVYSKQLAIPITSIQTPTKGLIYYNFKGWKGSMLQYYWVPIPKGYRYKIGDVMRQASSNGLLNLINGRFEPFPGSSIYSITDGEMTKPYDYFYNWTFEQTDANYIVKTNSEANTFTYPDELSIGVRTLPAGLVMPISKVTSDASNYVIGEWYFSGDQWMKSNQASIYAGLLQSRLNKLQQDICLVEPANKTTDIYYVYLDPESATSGQSSDTTYSNTGIVVTAYYNYTNGNGEKYFFDGNRWIPEAYTSLNTVEWNKNYAISADNINFYSHPIADDVYKVGTYHYGERVTVPYVCAKDETWGYTGLGWIQLTASNVSEIIS